MKPIKHFVVISRSDEIKCYINAFTIGNAIDILKQKYPDEYKHFDMYQIKIAFVGCETIERICNELSETEER